MKKGKIITFIVILVVLILIFNYTFKVLLPIKPVKLESESMSPAYAKGDILFYTKPISLEEGDVVIFSVTPRFDMIARIVEINEDGTYRTKGDNNEDSFRIGNNPQGLDETQIQEDQIYGKIKYKNNSYVLYIISYGIIILIALALTNPIYKKVSKK